LAGTVDATIETVLADARKDVVGAALVAAEALDDVELDLLTLDPPQPASATVASEIARINLVFIGHSSSRVGAM